MTNSSTSILFLSGAGLPAWIWDGVRAELAGVDTRVAPRPDGGRHLRDYADAALAAAAPGPFVIVAHSAGGVVAAEIARLAPERVAGVLAVSAAIPAVGGSFISAMPLPNRWILGLVLRFAGTKPPESAIRSTLAHGIEPDVVQRLIDEFTPEPLGFYRDRVGEVPWNCPRGYLSTTGDKELPPALQRTFAQRLGATWAASLPTGHLPMLQDPVGVARSVAAFAAA
ncbi:MAG: alpha/beta hydrolase [Arachnia sp.]